MSPEKNDSHTDPVAQSIRNQQMRDATPSEEPTPPTCDDCGERPGTIYQPESYNPSCDARQSPPMTNFARCERCFNPTTKQDAIDSKLDEHDAVVEYGCGVLKTVDRDDAPEPVPRDWSPTLRLYCRCGSAIETVHTPGEDR